jgi:hypothetical protein
LGLIAFLLLFASTHSAFGWGSTHAQITQAAYDVQPQALRNLWVVSYQHPQDGSTRTIQAYLLDYFWWSGNPDHVDGPLNGTFASEDRKNYAKLFHYGERGGAFAVPTPTGLPLPPEGSAWTYHYFNFSPSENAGRAERGAEWYFDRIVEAFLDDRDEDAAQYAGSFAHAIEDRSSTVHAWDGYGAERSTVESQNGVNMQFWFINDNNVSADIAGYDPLMLGTNSAEAAQELSVRLQSLNDESRANLSDTNRYLGSHLNDDWMNSGSSPATDAHMAEMARGSSRLLADAFFTGFMLAFPDAVDPGDMHFTPDHDNYTEAAAGVQDHTGNLSLASTSDRQAYLKFDISSLPGGGSIQSATLTMRTRNDFLGDATANVYSVADDSWLETTIEDSNKPAFGPVIGSFPIEGTATLMVSPGTSQLDIIDVTGWVATNYNNSDFQISIGLLEVGSSITFFRADEHSDQSEHPWALLSIVMESDSPPAFTNITVGTETGFEFNSAAGTDYRLECSTNGMDWTDKNIVLHGLGQTEILFDPNGFDSNRAYRIMKGTQ